MKTAIIFIISLTCFASSCSLLKNVQGESVKAEKNTEEKSKPETVEIKKPQVGDKVIARWGPISWAEGKVESIEKDNATVVWKEDNSKNEVALKEVFLPPTDNAKATVKVGDYAVVKGTGNWWYEAEIKEVNGDTIKAINIYNRQTDNITPSDILQISPVVAADIKDAGEKQNFLAEAQSHKPVIADGYKPKVGERVLAAWMTTSWQPAKVKSVTDDKAMLVWEGGMNPEQLDLSRITAFPTADAAQTPSVNDFVLLKPAGGSWIYGQITKVNGTSIEAKTIDSTEKYKAGEYVILE